ncbi:MAG: hypothetical protein JWM33_399 [Caulobacteraceae bacterium]|nr:hypothetical protein [Caulobacteraceae bacterium]
MTSQTADQPMTPDDQALVEFLSKSMFDKARGALARIEREMQILRIDPRMQAIQWRVISIVATSKAGGIENA